MARMLIALALPSIFGVVIFGLPALLNIVVSVAVAVGAEAGFRRLIKQESRIRDCSAAVTGLLLALIIPPSTPLWMTALGALFAIVVAKEFFGGLGANVFNPALTGRAFMIMSFPAALTTWDQPVDFGAMVRDMIGATPLLTDVVSSATPLLTDAVSTATPLNIIRQGGILADAGTSYGSIIQTLFLGFRSGSIGETSIVLIIISGVFLLVTQTIDWRAPLSMICSAFLCSWILGMDPVVGILSGGLFFGAVFMATDYVSAPITSPGKLLFGCGAGIITVLIRKWGAFPEGVTYSILIMNAVSPFFNRLTTRKYGFVPAKK